MSVLSLQLSTKYYIFISRVCTGQVCHPSCVIPNSSCHQNVIIPPATKPESESYLQRNRGYIEGSNFFSNLRKSNGNCNKYRLKQKKFLLLKEKLRKFYPILLSIYYLCKIALNIHKYFFLLYKNILQCKLRLTDRDSYCL